MSKAKENKTNYNNRRRAKRTTPHMKREKSRAIRYKMDKIKNKGKRRATALFVFVSVVFSLVFDCTPSAAVTTVVVASSSVVFIY